LAGAPGAASKVIAPGRKLIGRTYCSTSSRSPMSRLAAIRARTSSNEASTGMAWAPGAAMVIGAWAVAPPAEPPPPMATPPPGPPPPIGAPSRRAFSASSGPGRSAA